MYSLAVLPETPYFSEAYSAKLTGEIDFSRLQNFLLSVVAIKTRDHSEDVWNMYEVSGKNGQVILWDRMGGIGRHIVVN